MSNPSVGTMPDIISTIKLNVGVEPKDAVVLILIADGRIRAYMMHSIPEGGMDVEHIMQLCQSLSQVEFEAFVTVAYTDREPKCASHPAWFHESVAFSVAIEKFLGADCLGGAVVTSEHWVNYKEVVESEGDYPRHPLTEITDSPVALEIQMNHGTKVRNAAYIPEGGANPQFNEHLRTFFKTLDKPQEWEEMAASPDTVRARELWERCLARDFGPLENEAAELVAYFINVHRRDRLVADVISTTTDKEMSIRILTGQADLPIRNARHDSAIALLTNLLQYTTGKPRTNLLIALGFLSWLRGDSFHAGEYLEAVPEKYRNTDNDWEQLYSVISHGGLAQSAARPPMP